MRGWEESGVEYEILTFGHGPRAPAAGWFSHFRSILFFIFSEERQRW